MSEEDQIRMLDQGIISSASTWQYLPQGQVNQIPVWGTLTETLTSSGSWLQTVGDQIASGIIATWNMETGKDYEPLKEEYNFFNACKLIKE